MKYRSAVRVSGFDDASWKRRVSMKRTRGTCTYRGFLLRRISKKRRIRSTCNGGKFKCPVALRNHSHSTFLSGGRTGHDLEERRDDEGAYGTSAAGRAVRCLPAGRYAPYPACKAHNCMRDEMAQRESKLVGNCGHVSARVTTERGMLPPQCISDATHRKILTQRMR